MNGDDDIGQTLWVHGTDLSDFCCGNSGDGVDHVDPNPNDNYAGNDGGDEDDDVDDDEQQQRIVYSRH